MDEIQAAVLEVKFRHLDMWVNSRRKLAKLYHQQLADVSEIICPIEIPTSKHAYNLYTIRAKKRDKLRDYLQKEGIGTAIHYPYPLHTQKVFAFLKYKSDAFPNSQLAAKEVLSIPLYPDMPEEHIDIVSEKIKKFYQK